jgi:ribosomal protein S18 acetylase RimI-like enzyme
MSSEMTNQKEITGKATIRQLTSKDLEAIIEVEEKTWPEDWQASREAFESRMKIFPQGAMGIFEENKLAGVTTSMKANFDLDELPQYNEKWEEITKNGMITNHDKDGNALYVVSVGVQAESQGGGYGSKLVAAQTELGKKEGCQYLFLGARLPRLREYLEAEFGDEAKVIIADEERLKEEAENYLDKRREDGERLDPEIRFYEKCGLIVGRLTQPDFGPDPESCNFGVIMYKDL